MSSTPEKIGNFKILDVLGRGGMGVVYKACDKQTGDVVALKTVIGLQERIIQCIRREILSLSCLDHPGIIPVFDQGLHEGIPWYAMEFIDGLTLKHYLHVDNLITSEGGPPEEMATALLQERSTSVYRDATASVWWTKSVELDAMTEIIPDISGVKQQAVHDKHLSQQPPDKPREINLVRIVKVLHHLCDALSFLHGEGYVHRDLKPDNILVRQNGQPVIVDFGLMSQFSGRISRETLSVEHGSLGTLNYIAPEQLIGGFVDARADLYSLSCIMYELLAGFPPFVSEKTSRVIKAHLSQEPVPLNTYRPDIPRELSDVVMKLLEKSPRNRLGYADDIIHVLQTLGAESLSWTTSKESRPYVYRSRYMGQDELVREFETCLENLSKNKGTLVMVQGKSGVGKTRFVMEMGQKAVARDIMVLTGETCSKNAHPLEVFRKPLQNLADRCFELGKEYTTKIFGEWGPVLACYEPSISELAGHKDCSPLPELPPDAARLRVFQALFDVFSRVAQETGLILILDDLQWADELTTGFIDYLRRSGRLENTPLLIVGSARSEDISDDLQNLIIQPGIQTIAIRELRPEAVRLLVNEMLAVSKVPEMLLDYLVKHGQGNPFYCAEYLRMIILNKLLKRDTSGQWKFSPTAFSGDSADGISLETLIKHRLESLSHESRLVIKHIAVLGRQFSCSLLNHMIDLPDETIQTALDELINFQILEKLDIDTLRFINEQYQLEANNLATREEQKNLHAQAARTIEAFYGQYIGDYREQLGHHWEQAGKKEKACINYLEGARHARSQFSYQQAERLFLAYLRIADKNNPKSVAARLELARDILQLSGKNRQALDHYRYVLEQTGEGIDNEAHTSALRLTGNIHWYTGNQNKARQLWNKALKLAGITGNELQQGKLFCNLATWFRANGDTAKARELYERDLEITLREQDYIGHARTLINLASMMNDEGHPGEARDCYQQALDLARRSGNILTEIKALGNIAGIYYSLGNVSAAEEHYLEALGLVRKAGDRKTEGFLLGYLARLYMSRGKLDLAEHHYNQALAITREIDYRIFEANTLGSLAVLHERRGNSGKAEKLYLESLAVHKAVGDRRQETTTMINLADFYFNQGNIEKTVTLIDQVLAVGREMNYRRIIAYSLGLKSTVERLFLGNLRQAEVYARDAEDIFVEVGDSPNLIDVYCEQGHITLARGKSARAFLGKAEVLADRLQISNNSESRDRIDALQRALKEFQQGGKKLHRGTFLDDIPEGLRERILGEGSSPGTGNKH